MQFVSIRRLILIMLMLFFSDCRTYYITVNVHFTSRAVRKGKDRAVSGTVGTAEASTPNQNIIDSKAER